MNSPIDSLLSFAGILILIYQRGMYVLNNVSPQGDIILCLVVISFDILPQDEVDNIDFEILRINTDENINCHISEMCTTDEFYNKCDKILTYVQKERVIVYNDLFYISCMKLLENDVNEILFILSSDDKTRTQLNVCHLYNYKYPIAPLYHS